MINRIFKEHRSASQRIFWKESIKDQNATVDAIDFIQPSSSSSPSSISSISSISSACSASSSSSASSCSSSSYFRVVFLLLLLPLFLILLLSFFFFCILSRSFPSLPSCSEQSNHSNNPLQCPTQLWLSPDLINPSALLANVSHVTNLLRWPKSTRICTRAANLMPTIDSDGLCD